MKRVGLVGTGLMGRWHAKRWQQLPVDLVGFYDHTQVKAEAAASDFGGQAFKQLSTLLEAVDVVDVCVPTPAHKELVIAAAEAGKAIVCEKPLTRSVADAEEMIEACDKAGVRLFVAQVVRFFPMYAQAKACLDSGALGSPGVMRLLRGGAPPRSDPNSWYYDLEQSGRVVLDLSIHDLDFARWCFGEVERVFAYGRSFEHRGIEDHCVISLRFHNGAIAHLEGSWHYPPGPFRTALEIAGSEGIVEWDSSDPPALALRLAESVEGHEQVPQSDSPLAPDDDPYYLELKHFLDCLESGEAFVVSPRDGLEAVRLALAALESMRLGRPVEMALFATGAVA